MSEFSDSFYLAYRQTLGITSQSLKWLEEELKSESEKLLGEQVVHNRTFHFLFQHGIEAGFQAVMAKHSGGFIYYFITRSY